MTRVLPTFRRDVKCQEAGMADKRKAGQEGSQQPRRGGGEVARPAAGRRRRGRAEAGRIAVRPEAAPYRRAVVDEHAEAVRQRIEAAIANGRRIREEIEGRIDEQLAREEEPGGGGEAGKVITRMTAKARPAPRGRRA